MIRFHCLECGKLIKANDSAVGRAAKCPGCGAVVEIPQASFPAPPPPPKAVPAPPPVTPPSAPKMAAQTATEPLSLEELLGSTAAVAPSGNHAVSATTTAAVSEDAGRTAGKAGSKTAGKTAKQNGVKAAVATKREKASARGGAIPTKKIRNLSFAAIGAGALGLALFAVPYAGPAVGVIGAVVGFYCVFLASARRNSPMILALAGIALSVIAACFGGYWTFQAIQATPVAASAENGAPEANPDATAAQQAPNASLAVDFNQFAGAAVKAIAEGAVADSRNPLNFAAAAVRGAAADPSKKAARLASADGAPAIARATGPVTLRLQGSAGGSEKGTDAGAPTGESTPSGDSVSAPAAAAKGPIQWAAADKGEAQGNDDVQVTVLKVMIGTLHFRLGSNALLDERETEAKFLHIRLKIQNNQTAGTIDYKGWMTLPDSDATLTDDQGTEIKRFDINTLASPTQHLTIVNSHPSATIEISQSNEDVIIFHLPPDGAQYLRLTLSGKAAGLGDDLHFQIPRSMITTGETGNSLLPLDAP
jgi:hypothetical protein